MIIRNIETVISTGTVQDYVRTPSRWILLTGRKRKKRNSNRSTKDEVLAEKMVKIWEKGE